MMTVVMPLYCNLRRIAKAVSLCRIFWNGFSCRNTIWRDHDIACRTGPSPWYLPDAQW